MNIVFTHGNKQTEISLPGACEVKYYAVPSAYSDDGYFAAVWFSQDLEPVPACAPEHAELLAHVRIAIDMEGACGLQELFCKEGVTYA